MTESSPATGRLAFVRVILFIIASAAVVAVIAPALSGLSGKWRELATGVVAAPLTLALTALFVRWDHWTLRDAGAVAGAGSFFRLVAGFAFGSLLLMLWALLMIPAGHVRWMSTDGFHPAGTALALAAYLALAWREELAFRGYPLRRLNDVYGPVVAQVVVAFLFAVEHRVGGMPWLTALTGVAASSLLFGAAALATEGLAVPIGIHAAWNFGQWSLGLRGPTGFWRPVLDPQNQPRADHAGLFLSAAVMLAAMPALFWWRRRRTQA